MSNMSYCRFHNTRMDLNDCLNALEENETISKDELHSAVSMFESFLEFCENEGIIDGYDSKTLNKYLNNFLE